MRGKQRFILGGPATAEPVVASGTCAASNALETRIAAGLMTAAETLIIMATRCKEPTARFQAIDGAHSMAQSVRLFNCRCLDPFFGNSHVSRESNGDVGLIGKRVRRSETRWS